MQKFLVSQSNGFENVALNVDTYITQNLELLLDAADFTKFLAMADFKHYELRKWDWIRTSDGEGVIYILILRV